MSRAGVADGRGRTEDAPVQTHFYAIQGRKLKQSRAGSSPSSDGSQRLKSDPAESLPIMAVPARAATPTSPTSYGDMDGDDVIFSESPARPGVLVARRTEAQRMKNPERINLNRRRLKTCPVLEGEEGVRLLNFQNNLISCIDGLASLRNLIFLDLYNNKLTAITNLACVPSLRVLMLGKNMITKIEGLDRLLRLDVVDLHSNHIRVIENVSHLTEMRVLNLAGNMITSVSGVSSLSSLMELNLRRNRIHHVGELDLLPRLQRVFLSHNDLDGWRGVDSVLRSPSIQELTMDGNPLANSGGYTEHVMSSMPTLTLLDMRRVTSRGSAPDRGASLDIQRESNVSRGSTRSTLVEVEPGPVHVEVPTPVRVDLPSAVAELPAPPSGSPRMPVPPPKERTPRGARSVAERPSSARDRSSARMFSSARAERPDTAKDRSRSRENASGRSAPGSMCASARRVPSRSGKRDSGTTSPLSVVGTTLYVNDDENVRPIDKRFKDKIVSVVFRGRCGDFERAAALFGKVRKVAGGNVEAVAFPSCRNLRSMQQLRQLRVLGEVTELTMEGTGSLLDSELLPLYIAHHLPSLEVFNGHAITKRDRAEGLAMFGPLESLKSSSLPVPHNSARRRLISASITAWTSQAEQRAARALWLHENWPRMVSHLVEDALKNMEDLDGYMDRCLHGVEGM